MIILSRVYLRLPSKGYVPSSSVCRFNTSSVYVLKKIIRLRYLGWKIVEMMNDLSAIRIKFKFRTKYMNNTNNMKYLTRVIISVITV